MNIGVNQFCFPSSYGVAEALKSARALGFDSFEACLTADGGARDGGVADALDIAGYVNPLLNVSSSESDIRELKRVADGEGIRITGVGGIVSFSIYPLNAREESVARKSLDAVRKMLDAARILGADTALVIPGLLTADMDYRGSYERAHSRLAILADYAPDIAIAVENVWNNCLYSPMELAAFVDQVGRANVGIYFDVANARRFGYPEQWIRTLGRRIRRLHCKDYRVSNDNIHSFTNLLDGDVDYPAVMDALREIGYGGELVVELIPPARTMVERTLAYARGVLVELIAQK